MRDTWIRQFLPLSLFPPVIGYINCASASYRPRLFMAFGVFLRRCTAVRLARSLITIGLPADCLARWRRRRECWDACAPLLLFFEKMPKLTRPPKPVVSLTVTPYNDFSRPSEGLLFLYSVSATFALDPISVCAGTMLPWRETLSSESANCCRSRLFVKTWVGYEIEALLPRSLGASSRPSPFAIAPWRGSFCLV